MKKSKENPGIYNLCSYCNGRGEYLLVTEYQKCIWCNGRGIRKTLAH